MQFPVAIRKLVEFVKKSILSAEEYNFIDNLEDQ